MNDPRFSLALDGGAIKAAIDALRAACGTLFEPRQIRRIAQAKADATIIRAEGEHELARLELEHETLLARLEDEHERIRTRLYARETVRQTNLDAINAETVMALAAKGVTDEKVEQIEQDWLMSFINKAQEISDEDLQRLWANLLADKVQRQRPWSKRTLAVLAEMSPAEANLFKESAPFLVSCPGGRIGYSATVTFTGEATMKLSDAGLVIQGQFDSQEVASDFEIAVGARRFHLTRSVFPIAGVPGPPRAALQLYRLTRAGLEIARLLDFSQVRDDYASDVLAVFETRGFEAVEFGDDGPFLD